MVQYSIASLDRTFAALADPTRRALLARLSESEAVSVSELAKPFEMSLPAILKHLDVLKDAGLVAREKNGRIVSCRLKAGPMQEANEWLNRYQQFWNESLDKLEAMLETDQWSPQPQSSRKPRQIRHQASPSSGGSARRQPKSTPRGPTRKK